MKMICLLWLCVRSSGNVGGHRVITHKNYARVVEKRVKAGETWLVMFHTDTVRRSREALVEFLDYSNKLVGVVNFGLINTKDEPKLLRRFMPDTQPAFVVIDRNGSHPCHGKRVEMALACVEEFIPSAANEANLSWMGMRALVLFRQEQRVPLVWRGIAARMPSDVMVGVGRDEAFARAAGVGFGAVVFFNETTVLPYRGEISVPKIVRTAEKFFAGGLVIGKKVIYDAADFERKCVRSPLVDMCVLETRREASNELIAFMESVDSAKIRCFAGQGGPWEALGGRPFWVFERSRGLTPADSTTAVESILAIPNSTTWRRVEAFIAAETGRELGDLDDN